MYSYMGPPIIYQFRAHRVKWIHLIWTLEMFTSEGFVFLIRVHSLWMSIFMFYIYAVFGIEWIFIVMSVNSNDLFGVNLILK